MDKNKKWKWLLLGGLLIWSIVLVTPPKDKIKLGLDLKGGSSFVVQVDRNDVARKMVEKDKKISSVDKIKATDLNKEVTDVRDAAVGMIRNRINALGTAETSIYPEGDDRIIVRMPGAGKEDQAKARELIEKDGVLTFQLVDVNNAMYVQQLLASKPAPKGFVLGEDGYIRDKSALADEKLDREYYENLKVQYSADYPANLMLQKSTDKNGKEVYQPCFVESRIQMTGEDITKAGFSTDIEKGGYKIDLSFGKEGKKRFADVTREYSQTGRRLAIVLDGVLCSSPTLNEPITDGSATISGNFSAAEARDLVNVLRAGSMPGRVVVKEERSVSPTLGEDSVKSGVAAIIAGGVAVLIFMGVYYLVPGMIANLSLVFVFLLLPVGLLLSSGFLGAASGSLEGASVSLPTLTLYGIAGIVLTLGMAVDANVLTFERMREEWKVGKSISGAINAGYNKAFSTILDANVTTMLTAVILFWKGSDAIRGFAVTLCAGILVSMFIVLVITRLFFNTLADKGILKSIKMFSLPFLRNANFDFVGKRKVAAFISVALIVVSWAWFATKGDANFGVDFTGGTVAKFAFEKEPAVEGVRAALEDAGIKNPVVNVLQSDDQSILELKLKAGALESETTAISVIEKIDGYKEPLQNDHVGSEIGKELTKKGIWAIVWALVGIIIYISIRFEFAFAMGAIVALAHDVLITIGIYCACGRELSLPIVAALLTIVGYSVNDTIVVFDRIREDLKLEKGKSYKDIANLSINQTLSRTLMTSVTTLLTVVMLLLFGGGAVNDFALALFIGVLVGTYSSIFVATPVVLFWHKEEDKAEVEVTP